MPANDHFTDSAFGWSAHDMAGSSSIWDGWDPWMPTVKEPEGACPHCSGPFSWVMHSGRCPWVEAIEYHPNGSIKRIEYRHNDQPLGGVKNEGGE